MASSPSALVCILLPFLVCFFYSPSSLAAILPSKPHALFLKVTKDPSTSQYITEIKQRTPLVPVKLTFDLGGDQLWVDCDKYISSTYKPVLCNSTLCKLLLPSLGCDGCNGPQKPGCNHHSCSKFPYNTISKSTGVGEVGKDVISVQSTDGSNPGKYVSFPRLAFTCSRTSLLNGLAKGVKGIAGFSKSPISIYSQLSNAFRLPHMFAMCLSSSNGFAIIGAWPYNVAPGIDLSNTVTYTPIISYPDSEGSSSLAGNDPANEYYLGVTKIKVNSKQVPVNTTLLEISQEGKGGTKFSTVVPYTVLERSIYKAITNAFVKALSKVPKVKAVAPFEICYKSSSFSSTLLGPGVPSIEFVLQKESATWEFFGLNSMVPVKGKALCLGFVDGGLNPETSIVIGGYQLENAFLEFDFTLGRLGFASTIIGQRTSCANFNFTSSV